MRRGGEGGRLIGEAAPQHAKNAEEEEELEWWVGGFFSVARGSGMNTEQTKQLVIASRASPWCCEAKMLLFQGLNDKSMHQSIFCYLSSREKIRACTVFTSLKI